MDSSKPSIRRPWLARLAVASLFLASLAANAGQDGLAAHNARVRWLPGDLPMAGYFVLSNTGDDARTLTGATSPAFGAVKMHRSVEEDGQTSMTHAGHLVIAPGGSVTFAPGGLHLMLMKRQREIAPGDTLEIELQFDDGTRVPVRFRVVGADEG